MSRFVVAFCLLLLFSCSIGCRICAPPCEYPVSAHINRPYDYRGSDPMYRAGSIFSGCCGTQSMVRHAYYEGEDEYTDYYSNAGNYGVTSPVSLVSHTPSTGTGTFDTLTEPIPGLIGVPNHVPGGNVPDPPSRNGVPTIEELLNQRKTIQLPTPLTPSPGLQVPPSLPGSDAIPFSPSDSVPNGTVPGAERLVPPSTFPMMKDTQPPITLEELQRLDPTIQDVQIISIEDVAPVSLR